MGRLRERRKAFRGGAFPTDQLKSFYLLGEASGDALDSFGSNDYTEQDAVGATTITIGGDTVDARSIDLSSGNVYFKLADNADFDVGIGDFTLATWMEVPASTPNNTAITPFGKRNNITSSDAGYTFALATRDGDGTIKTQATSEVCDGTNEKGFTAEIDIGADTGTPFHLIFTIERGSVDLMNLYVNNGSTVESVDISNVTGSLDNSIESFIGRFTNQASGDTIADLTHLGFWKKALTSSERTTLYNSGKVLAP